MPNFYVFNKNKNGYMVQKKNAKLHYRKLFKLTCTLKTTLEKKVFM